MSSWASRTTRYPKRVITVPNIELPPPNTQYIDIPNEVPKEIVIPIEKKYERTSILPINVLFISNIQSGGTKKYIDDIINNFKSQYINFKRITSKYELLTYTNTTHMTSNDIVFFQHLINTDLEMDDIIQFKQKYGCKLILTLHDFYLLKDDYQHYNPILHSLYLENVEPIKKHQELLDLVDEVVAPSHFVLDEVKRVYNIKYSYVSEHIDYLSKTITNYIPQISDNIINIALPHEFSEYKGRGYYLDLINSVSKFKYNKQEYTIKYHIFPKKYDPIVKTLCENTNVVIHPEYDEDELYTILKNNNIHLLTYLNKWGETYCYSVTKGINSGLPILYNNIGALKERIDATTNNFYFPIQSEDNTIIKLDNIKSQLYKALKFIINNTNNIEPNVNTYLHIPSYYYTLFTSHYINYLSTKYNNNKDKYHQVFNTIQPYSIYFPQFHEMPENNLTYYKGFTDLVNLKSVMVSENKDKYDFTTPLNGLLGYYDLKLNNITNTQVALAKAYGIKGFAMYYYWFSTNTVTNKRHIMKDVVDSFFKDTIDDFDIFFIFANEGWSNNPAFANSNNPNTIKTDYTVDNIFACCIDLIPYFKHPNYRKIDNKPVLLLHHPWELTRKQLKLFKSILDVVCIDNDFDGAHLIINSMNGIQEEFSHYSHHPEYKNRIDSIIWKDSHSVINYDDYVNTYVGNTEKENKSIIRGCFPNFNNYVRLFYNDQRDGIHTSTENNSDNLFEEFLRKQIKYYKDNSQKQSLEVNKIILLNSWNEWGEQMAFEPSNEHGFKYLDIVYNELVSLL
jgi:hypothetical protein